MSHVGDAGAEPESRRRGAALKHLVSIEIRGFERMQHARGGDREETHTHLTEHCSLATLVSALTSFSFLQFTTVQSQRFCEYAIYPVVAQLGSWLPWQTVASLATPAFRAPGQPLWRCMLNRECMQNDGSFGAWLKLYVLGKWRITHRTAWPPQPNGSHWASAAVPQPKRRMLRTSCNMLL